VPRRIHVVREGDTLDKLARQYYDAPARWRQIYDANEALLTGGRPLHVGMELEIPAP
jgi:nucleoid-associated protein YgaU